MSQPFRNGQVTTTALIALGANVASNWGQPSDTILAAFEQLESDSVNIMKNSRFFASPAYPVGSGPDFVNAVSQIRTTLCADRLLAVLHEIEAAAGRRRVARWEPRILDLDLLSFDDQIWPSHQEFTRWADMPAEDQARVAPKELVLPHPRIQDRGFVLVPLCDVAPEWRHPVLRRSASEMRDALPAADLAQIRPI